MLHLTFAALLALGLGSEGRDHPGLLGVVAVSEGERVVVAEVVRGSPAGRIGLVPGDVLLSLDGHSLASPLDLDRAVRTLDTGTEFRLTARRDGEPLELEPLALVSRAGLPVTWTRPRKTGQLGLPALPWHGFAWANLADGEAPPSLESSRGKVVVIHAFQSW